MTKKEFVFYDKGKRWSTVKKVFFSSIILFCVTLLYIFHTILSNPLTMKNNLASSRSELYEIIDDISSKVPEKIEVEGSGPFLKISEDQGNFKLEAYGKRHDKVIALTFDDGPDPYFSEQILAILKKEEVGATFFVVGDMVYRHPEIFKKIILDGHEVGNHTFSHTSEEVDLYQKNFKNDFDLNFTQKLIERNSGYTTSLFRSPYWGTDNLLSMNNLILTAETQNKGYQIFGSTLDSEDWQFKNPAEIIRAATNTSGGGEVILFHDGGGDRNATVKALPEVIKFYKDRDYKFVTGSEYANQSLLSPTTDEQKLESRIAVSSYHFYKNIPAYLGVFLKIGLLISLVSLSLNLFLSLASLFKGKRVRSLKDFTPLISVIIPAFNEKKVIKETLRSVLNSKYKNFEVFVINDGSTDSTPEIVEKFLKDKRVGLINKNNGGKSSAINAGLKRAQGEIVVIIDADTLVCPDTLSNLIYPFIDPRVGAVAGHIKVGNRNNLLTFFQTIEYTVSLNLERRAHWFLNAIFIVPGAIGAWRKEILDKIGGFNDYTLSEDAEATLRVQKLGFKVQFAPTSFAYTEAPETIDGLIRQRFRWTYGLFQAIFKHRDLLFNRRFGLLGFLVLPITIFVQIPTMLTASILDIWALSYLILIGANPVVFYYLIYLAMSILISFISFILSKEDLRLLLALPFVRILYQPILALVLYKVFLNVLKGNYIRWQKLSHSGSVRIKTLIDTTNLGNL
ncbi:MAG: hypothetical protein A2Y57_00640 [Candidatus Woykebacteria bacterium RBG_13_40_7b]|uniref:NodB homology domain-containing protein n=1 Tax=Candidatus Woykebacteria bacterium RBG_13_40_7b TaxID=1802594 RepID=A0A1G1W8G9_9BACT|nr:MAG: hypothetical protein A2Y57_00640 [Candidatus Woykebacteria bacterium RBG_13_40_7b]